MKHYFNVSNAYVLRKLYIVLFPWRHRPWSRQQMRMSSNGQTAEFLPPREDINSPGTLCFGDRSELQDTDMCALDMYIPVMAFVTYILLSTLIAGLNGRFEPQLLGITFSNAFIIIVLELLVLWLGRYFLNISSESQIYDLVAYIGYKFVGVIATVSVSAVFSAGNGTGGWVGWAVFGYTFLANAFFLVGYIFPPCQGSRETTDAPPFRTASKSQVRAPTVRPVARQSEHADNCALTAVSSHSISVSLQLCGAACLYVVAELYSNRWTCHIQGKRGQVRRETLFAQRESTFRLETCLNRAPVPSYHVMHTERRVSIMALNRKRGLSHLRIGPRTFLWLLKASHLMVFGSEPWDKWPSGSSDTVRRMLAGCLDEEKTASVKTILRAQDSETKGRP